MKYPAGIALLLAGVPAAAQPVPEGIHREGTGNSTVCGRPSADIGALQRQIAAELGNPQGNDRFIAFIDDAAMRAWTFTRPGHPAHPAVACRTMREQDGAWGVQTEISCLSSRPNCDALYQEFARLNEALRRDLSGR